MTSSVKRAQISLADFDVTRRLSPEESERFIAIAVRRPPSRTPQCSACGDSGVIIHGEAVEPYTVDCSCGGGR